MRCWNSIQCSLQVYFCSVVLKAIAVMTCCRLSFFSFFFFFFCLLRCFPPHRPYAGASFLFVLFSSVKHQLSSSCFVLATAVIFFVFCPCNRYLFLFSTYVVRVFLQPFLSFPISLHHILQNTCRLICIVFFFLLCFFSSLFLFFLSSSVFCCVLILVPGTLTFNVIFLD